MSFIIGVFSTALFVIIDHLTIIYNRIWLAILCNTKYRKSFIRFSISYLYKIKVDDKYLLVKGHRVKDQFQPVGGVFKRFKSSNAIFKKLKILDDEYMPIDSISVDDLRVLVPAPNVLKFLKWYNSKSDREVNPEREFKEELLETGILPKKNFKNLKYTLVNEIESKIKFSDHFQCHEILKAEIYEIDLSKKQISELRKIMSQESSSYIWLDAQQIRKKGYSKDSNIRISDTSTWIL
ncbi:hypothetical protein AB9K26_14515 [Psychroserpens sp. XS_ASV72]|uniref:SMODS-associated NUDIX domain-containing protein n=1 Tax=Psychroserpens sp. XS_ASV72 TaxID=3241293 RepID=UPI003511247B